MFTTLILCLSIIHAAPIPGPGLTSSLVPGRGIDSVIRTGPSSLKPAFSAGRRVAGLSVVAKASSGSSSANVLGASSFEFADLSSRIAIQPKLVNAPDAQKYFEATVHDLNAAQKEWASTEELLDQTVLKLAAERAKLEHIRNPSPIDEASTAASSEKEAGQLLNSDPAKELGSMKAISDLEANVKSLKKDLVHKKADFMVAKKSFEQVGRLSPRKELVSKSPAVVHIDADEKPMSGAQREAAINNLEKSFKLNPWNTPSQGGQDVADLLNDARQSGNPLDAFDRWMKNLQKKKNADSTSIGN